MIHKMHFSEKKVQIMLIFSSGIFSDRGQLLHILVFPLRKADFRLNSCWRSNQSIISQKSIPSFPDSPSKDLLVSLVENRIPGENFPSYFETHGALLPIRTILMCNPPGRIAKTFVTVLISHNGENLCFHIDWTYCWKNCNRIDWTHRLKKTTNKNTFIIVLI